MEESLDRLRIWYNDSQADLRFVESIIRECFKVYPNPTGDTLWMEHFYKHPTVGAHLTDEQAARLRKIVEQ